jgi:hypothetical protein
MKQILFILGVVTAQVTAQAQLANIRKLNNYPYNSSIEIVGMNAIISSGSESDTIPFTMSDKEVLMFTKKTDTAKISILKLNEENKADLKRQYSSAEYANIAKLSLLEQLCNRAMTIGSVMKLVNDNGEEGAAAGDTIGGKSDAPEFEDPALIKNEKEDNSIALYSIGAALGGLGLGFLLARTMKSKSSDSQQQIIPAAADNAADAITKQYNEVLMRAQQLEQQLANIKKEDETYYATANSNFVQPLKTALNKNNKEEVLKLAMQIAMQYISLTNIKTKREQNSDIYNYKSMLGVSNQQEEKAHKVVNKNTPTDEVPNEIKTVLQLLADNGVQSSVEFAYMNFIAQ